MVDEIVNVARAVHFEMSYLNHVSKSEILSESSFKYPAVEWLERKCGITKVLFEKAHPVFSRRRIDLCWKGNEMLNYIEMKFVKGETVRETEQQRYFDDLLRLAHILMSDVNARCYFIACGKTDMWMPCFQNFGVKRPEGGVPMHPYAEGDAHVEETIEGNYSKWFSFKSSDPNRVIDVKNFPEHYETFIHNYIFNNTEFVHPENLRFFTQLLWISEVKSMLSPCSTAVWKVGLIRE